MNQKAEVESGLKARGWIKGAGGKWRHDSFNVAHLSRTQAETYQWLMGGGFEKMKQRLEKEAR